ncbi:Uncharacterized protein OS=Sorangium cellulosum (strain So ce56) GN=sce5710 PE=4 SV=1 [Gemmataceae bacterium]|jgi:hypothetical protein|nr:Uncharacterized protein OS=Sorangium cellulosum (strain So ce56) GN=sce5710 PE=4 SV=1 [Gemmataceae bacterium]VTU00683.1 Uncharacterized protein OS=Sorangium cellulosum (strain So ce56) GN=sce5710 PE=4 SV=1 [Gemmataceae bacterium]
MTEAEWLEASEPGNMLWFMGKALSQRKLRLFACICCRRIWPLMTDPASRQAVEDSERYADALERSELLLRYDKDVASTQSIAKHGVGFGASAACFVSSSQMNWEMALNATRYAIYALCPESSPFATPEAEARADSEEVAQAELLRDIFGNPFRPVAFSPEWRTDTAVSLAKHMYESRDFDAMPILADALQDAGCDSGAVLDHCRGPGPHVRGCWVVDLVLGKE